MFKRVINWKEFLPILLLCVFVSLANAKYSGGSGTAEDPYLISTPQDMNAIGSDSTDWNKHFKMTADINMAAYTGTKYKIIGNSTTNFTGTFDGNDHRIYNLKFSTTSSGYNIGLFGKTSYATIKNLGVEDVNISVPNIWFVGGLIGDMSHGSVINCYCTGKIKNSGYYCGGIVGYNSYGTLTNCYGEMFLNGLSYVGGLCGYHDGIINKCHSNSIITVSGEEAGGLCGRIGRGTGTTVFDSYAIGTVQGITAVGGFCGRNYSRIVNCFSAVEVAGTSLVGGFLGQDYSNANISGCFWDVEKSGINTSAGGAGVVGQTTTEMKTALPFVEAGWDFVGETTNGTNDVWRMCEDGISYPRLSWEFAKGDFVCPDGVDFTDFAVLANQWMQSPGYPSADIAPDTPDGVVDGKDLAVFAENWLGGVETRQPQADYVQRVDVQPCFSDLNFSPASTGNRFSITVVGSNLNFYDLINANCCITGINLDVTVDGNLIEIHEREEYIVLCTCVCDFPTTAVLGSFEAGTYIVEVFDVGGNSLGTTEVAIP